MRAAAEMKRQAAATHGQGGGAGKGMMGVVLPMYAVGIVLYLVYTMAKVQRHATSSITCRQLFLLQFVELI